MKISVVFHVKFVMLMFSFWGFSNFCFQFVSCDCIIQETMLYIRYLQTINRILKKKITMVDGVCIFFGAAAQGVHLFFGIYPIV